jgi:hypothetical protein
VDGPFADTSIGVNAGPEIAQQISPVRPALKRGMVATGMPNGERMRTTIFGGVPVEDYVRFMDSLREITAN